MNNIIELKHNYRNEKIWHNNNYTKDHKNEIKAYKVDLKQVHP